MHNTIKASLLKETSYSLLEFEQTRCTALLSEFQELAHAGIYEWDIIKNKIACSKELLLLFGKSVPDKHIAESNLFDTIDQEDFIQFVDKIRHSVESLSPVNCEFKVRYKDNTIKFLGLKGKVYANHLNHPVRLVGTVFDITERKWNEEELSNKNMAVLNAYKKLEISQQELKKLNNELENRVRDRTNALQQSESELRTLSETIPHLVWRVDSKGDYDYFNKKWFEYTGATFEQSVGRKWIDFVHADDRKNVKKAWKLALERGTAFYSEFRLKKHDGTYRWFLSQALPIEDSRGSITNWFGTSTDIQDQRMINEKKDEFIGIASHELKTPLTSIKAYIQLLLRNKNLTEDPVCYTYLEKTDSYINKLNTLIADLLDVSKIQAGKLQFNMSEFNFDDLARESVEAMQYITDTHKIILEGHSNAMVMGDKQRLEQVFFNFISNAIKYSPKGEKVIIRIEKLKNDVQVEIQDFGIGISKSNVDKLFSRFYRAEGLSPTFTGLGIGLFIAAEIIKRHNGKFWVESTEGEGSSFYFRLPLSQNKSTD